MIVVCGGGVGGLECIKIIQNNQLCKITLIEPNNIGGCCNTFHHGNNNISHQALFYYGDNKNDYNSLAKTTKEAFVKYTVDFGEIINTIYDYLSVPFNTKAYQFINNPKSKLFNIIKQLGGTCVDFKLPNIKSLHRFTIKEDVLSLYNKFNPRIVESGFTLKYIEDYNANFLRHYKPNLDKCELVQNFVTKIDIDNKKVYLKDNHTINFNRLILTMRIHQIIGILENSKNKVFNKILNYLKKIVFIKVISYVIEIEPRARIVLLGDMKTGICGSITNRNLLVIYANKDITENVLHKYCDDNKITYKKLLHTQTVNDYSPICIHDKYYDVIYKEIKRVYRKTNVLIPLGTLFANEIVYQSIIYHKKIITDVFIPTNI